ncbi:MAG: hypothetical protein WC728_00105 [Elusimicrobiota bacterium]
MVGAALLFLALTPAGAEDSSFIAEAARAESLVSECRLDDANEAFAGLRNSMGPLSPKSPLHELAVWTWRRRKAVRRFKAELDEFSGQAAKVLRDPAADPRAAAEAFALLSRLPPGCGRLKGVRLPVEEELRDALGGVGREKPSRERFGVCVQRGRELAAACRYRDSAGAFARALAVIDAEPGTRRARAAEYRRIRDRELPRVLAQASWELPLDSAVDRASSLSRRDPAGSLVSLLRACGAMRQLYGACPHPRLREAETLAETAGRQLPPPSPNLPADSTDEAAAKVSAERARLRALGALRSGRKAENESPSVPAEKQ